MSLSSVPGRRVDVCGDRCNFTNQIVDPMHFPSGNPHFCKSALSHYSQWDFIAMCERYSIACKERKHRRLFCKHSAKDVLAMLIRGSEWADG